MPVLLHLQRVVTAALLLLSVAACDLLGPSEDAQPAELRLSVTEVALDDTASARLQVMVIDADGEAVEDPAALAALTWSSADTTVATVSGGSVVARRRGTTEVSAALGELRATARVVVRAIPVKLEVAPDPLRLVVSTPVTLTATLRDRHGAPIPDAAVSWESADPSVATVSTTGVAQGLRTGVTEIRASSGTLAASVPTRVLSQAASHIEGFTIMPSAVNMFTGESTVTIAMRLTGEVGIDRSRQVTLHSWSFSPTCVFSPAPQPDGWLRCQFTVPGSTPADTLRVGDVVTGAGTRVTGTELAAAGFPTRIPILAAGGAPTLLGLTVEPRPLDVSSADATAKIRLRIRYPLTTGKEFYLFAGSPSGHHQPTCQRGDWSLESVTGHDETWVCSLLFPRYSEHGDWTISSLSLVEVDRTHQRRRSWGLDDLRAAGMQTTIVVHSPNAHLANPQLVDFRISPDTVRAGGPLRVRLRGRDPAALTSVYISTNVFKSAFGPATYYYDCEARLLSGTAEDGEWGCDLPLPASTTVRAQAISRVVLRDRTHKVREYSGADLEAAGFTTRFWIAP